MILQEIRDLWEAGESLSTRNLSRLGYAGMVMAAYRSECFGSWQEALAQAGLGPDATRDRPRKWTRERIRDRIRQLRADGQDLSYGAMKRRHPCLLGTASSPRFFGSWERAVEAAGLDYGRIRRYQRWTQERIIEQIQAIHRERGDLSSGSARREHPALFVSAVSRSHFGSWQAAVEAAGIDYASIRRRSGKQ